LTGHYPALLAAAALCGLIVGAVLAVAVMWFRQGKIRARMLRKRGGP
jgi:hypothetical protein